MPKSIKIYLHLKHVPSNCIMLSKLHFTFFIVLFHYIFLYPSTYALPITSKPIESTAENLAWEAWVMPPPIHQNQEKARKVTPKSIFVFQHKKDPICRPNEILHESKCLPIIEVNREDHLLAQIFNLFEGNKEDGNSDTNYNYDYELEAEDNVSNLDSEKNQYTEMDLKKKYENTNSSPDEPLKIDLFIDNFPTDILEEDNKDMNDTENNTNNVKNYENIRWEFMEFHNNNNTFSNTTIETDRNTNGQVNDTETTTSSFTTEDTTSTINETEMLSSDASTDVMHNSRNKLYNFFRKKISNSTDVEIYSQPIEQEINLYQILAGESLIPSEETITSTEQETTEEEEKETTITTIVSEEIDVTTNKLRDFSQITNNRVNEKVNNLNVLPTQIAQNFSTESTSIMSEETTLTMQEEIKPTQRESTTLPKNVNYEWKTESTEFPVVSVNPVEYNRYYYQHLGFDNQRNIDNQSNIEKEFRTLMNSTHNETTDISLPIVTTLGNPNNTITKDHNPMQSMSSSEEPVVIKTTTLTNVLGNVKPDELGVMLIVKKPNIINSEIEENNSTIMGSSAIESTTIESKSSLSIISISPTPQLESSTQSTSTDTLEIEMISTSPPTYKYLPNNLIGKKEITNSSNNNITKNNNTNSNTKRSSEIIEIDHETNRKIDSIDTIILPVPETVYKPSDFFWWLPSGWNWGSSEQSLLQRFWEAFHGDNAKAG